LSYRIIYYSYRLTYGLSFILMEIIQDILIKRRELNGFLYLPIKTEKIGLTFYKNFDGGKDRIRSNIKMLQKMRKSMKGFSMLGLSLVLAALIFSGCATPSVPVKYTEPGKLDMSGISRIAIDSDNTQVTNEISRRLTATGKYSVASAAELQDAKLAMYQATAIEVGATDLVGTYLANAVRADSSYGGKLLKTSGVVKEIGQTSKGRYFVRLEVGKDAVDVFFESSQMNKVASVNKGNTITVVGLCGGFKRPDMDDTAEILRILGAGQSVNISNATFPVEHKVDAILTVKTTFQLQDSSRNVKENQPVKDANGNNVKNEDGKVIYQEVNVTYYDRTGNLNINYQIVRTRGGSNVGQGTKSATSQRYSQQDPSKLPDASTIMSRIIEKPLVELASEMVPTERTINVTLAKEDKNKDAKKEMGEAEKLVKNKDYRAATTAYGKIYAQYKNFAADYNQAILTEGTEGTAAAIVLMEALVKQTNENLARTTLAEMQQRNSANQRAAQQLIK